VIQMDAHGWVLLAIGFVVSFVVAYGSVAWFMAYVRRRGFAPFACIELSSEFRFCSGRRDWGSKI